VAEKKGKIQQLILAPLVPSRTKKKAKICNNLPKPLLKRSKDPSFPRGGRQEPVSGRRIAMKRRTAASKIGSFWPTTQRGL